MDCVTLFLSCFFEYANELFFFFRRGSFAVCCCCLYRRRQHAGSCAYLFHMQLNNNNKKKKTAYQQQQLKTKMKHVSRLVAFSFLFFKAVRSDLVFCLLPRTRDLRLKKKGHSLFSL